MRTAAPRDEQNHDTLLPNAGGFAAALALAALIASLPWQTAAAQAVPCTAIENNEEPDATLYDHLGDIYAALKKTDKAREAWQKAISIEPSEALEKKLKGAGAAPATSSGNNPR